MGFWKECMLQSICLFDKLWDVPNEIGLKAFLAELIALEPNHHESDNEKTQDTIKEDCNSLSAELW
ncbi:14913_t:CDS:2, partial [Gigaspora rosea]